VKWGWLLLAFGGVVILLSSELTAHGERLTAGVLLALARHSSMPDRHHRPQTASAPRSILPLFRCSSAS
jgi:hypothetical protein